jgi:hypothetical protein
MEATMYSLSCSMKQDERTKKAEQIKAYTEKRLYQWYINAKKDYGVIGSGRVSVKVVDKIAFFTIDYTENGDKFSKTYGLYMDEPEKVSYLFDMWMEGTGHIESFNN